MSIRPADRSPYGMPNDARIALFRVVELLGGRPFSFTALLTLSATGSRTLERLAEELRWSREATKVAVVFLATENLSTYPRCLTDLIELTARGRRWAAALRGLAEFNDAPSRDGADSIPTQRSTPTMATKTTTPTKAAKPASKPAAMNAPKAAAKASAGKAASKGIQAKPKAAKPAAQSKGKGTARRAQGRG